jgi:ParB family transcriptional regulator, chromosome partitioning protein
MSKLDAIKKVSGAAIGESFGAGRTPGATPPGLDLPRSVTMPTRLQGTTKSRDALVIPTDRIAPDPGQPREEFDPDGIARLAESLKARGQLQPIRVRWDEEKGTYVLIMGERRWRAAVQAGLPTMSCVVHDAPIAPAELLALQLVENALREDLKPIEQAKAYERLMETHGWSGNQLAKELHIPQSCVSQALALLRLPDDVQDRVEAGELAPRTAYEVSKVAEPEAQRELAEQVVAGKLTGEQAAAVVKARKLGKTMVDPGGRREFKYPDGAKVSVTLPPGTSGSSAYLAIVQRVVKDLKAEVRDATRSTQSEGEAA